MDFEKIDKYILTISSIIGLITIIPTLKDLRNNNNSQITTV